MRRDVQEIFRMTPHEKQVMMFSATLSKEVRPVCKKFMQDVNMSSPLSSFTSPFRLPRAGGLRLDLCVSAAGWDSIHLWHKAGHLSSFVIADEVCTRHLCSSFLAIREACLFWAIVRWIVWNRASISHFLIDLSKYVATNQISVKPFHRSPNSRFTPAQECLFKWLLIEYEPRKAYFFPIVKSVENYPVRVLIRFKLYPCSIHSFGRIELMDGSFFPLQDDFDSCQSFKKPQSSFFFFLEFGIFPSCASRLVAIFLFLFY